VIFFVSHIIFLYTFKLIGYGDILLFNILFLFLPLNFIFVIIILTFIIGGIVTLILKIFISRDLKYVPLIPFVFLSFLTTSIFYKQLNIFLGGDIY